MKIRFWGVRGSIASPGQDTAEVGGNTSCVELDCGETRIVLDAGPVCGRSATISSRAELPVRGGTRSR